MADDLREDILRELESRVHQAIQVIQALQRQNEALESRVTQLESEIQQQDVTITELRERNAELLGFEQEIRKLREERRQEVARVQNEREQIRNRVQGILKLLDQADNPPV